MSEKSARVLNGYLMLAVSIVLLAARDVIL